MATHTLHSVALERPSPMSLPLMVERLRERLSTEQLSARLDKLLRELDKANA